MLNNLPLVSIIVPVFNVENYIKECLDSVIAQTYQNIEILCVDDCGTDNSIEIVKDYAKKDNRIKILTHNENRGLPVARNTGINKAKGEFIFFLDSDDYISENTIEELEKKAFASQADIILCDSTAFLDTKYQNVNLDNYLNQLNDWLVANYDSLDVTEKNYFSCLSKVSCISCGKLFKTGFINNNHLRFINRRVLHEDNGFQAKFLACNPRISCVHKNLYFYRIRENSITQNASNKAKKFYNLKLSIQDAISFITTSNNPSLAYELRDFYYVQFLTQNPFIKFYWGKRKKLLKILGIWIIKYSHQFDDTKRLSVLGIRLIRGK